MAEQKGGKKPYLQVVFWGAISLTAYALVFSNQAAVTDLVTRGGLYAALPIAAAFIFSFVHGSFASYVLSAMGIEAKGKRKK